MLWYVPKTKILDSEVRAGLSVGENPGVIVLPRFNLAVLVCADLWEDKFERAGDQTESGYCCRSCMDSHQ